MIFEVLMDLGLVFGGFCIGLFFCWSIGELRG